jgi:RNA polymerase sigma-70 factor (ECF subfamily)
MIAEAVSQPVRPSPSPPSEQSLRDLLRDHYDPVWRTLKRFGVLHAGVDDAAQQVFLVASRKLDQIERGRERSFLLGIAVRVASDARAAVRRRREVPLDEAAPEPPQPGPLPDDALGEKRGRAVLAAILEAMPLEMREAFVLFELEEFTAGEVAEMLGIPTGTVASRVRRGREHMRRHLAMLSGGAK